MCQTITYEMLVSSRNTNSVKRFNAQTGSYIDDFISSNSGGLNTTQDVIKGPEGNILVSGRGNTRILMYDKTTGVFLMPFTNGYALNNPTKITYGPDSNLYVSQWGTTNSKVVRFNGINGQFISEFTQSLNLPLGHTWDSAGNLYVACYGSGDVRKFDTLGNFSGIFTQSGHLQGPTNLWFDNSGSLLVIDWVLGSVIQFEASTGVFTKVVISGLQNAEGYSFGPDSNLYICDWSRNQIMRYTPEGIFMNIFATQGNMQAPNSILFREVKVSGISEVGNLINSFSLNQNYPNPFNPKTKIKFEIKKSSDVKITVTDVSGKLVSTLVDQQLNAGTYESEFDGKNFASGVYFYKLETSSGIFVKKMILMK